MNMEKEPLIEMQNITKRFGAFGRVTALDNVGLRIGQR